MHAPGWLRRATRPVAVSLLLVSLASLALVACIPQFAATPCPTTLLQTTTTFGDGQAIVNDCLVTIRTPTDITDRRQALSRFIWGADGFPTTKLPASVDRNVASPVSGLANLERVDRLNISMDAGQHTVTFHLIPRLRKNNRLVVVHQGHTCTMNDSQALTDEGPGLQRTINSLLTDGYSVLAAYMPHMNDQLPNDPCVSDHDTMFRTLTTTGSPMKFFLEPIAESLNYLQTRSVQDQFPQYHDFNMVGLSGGGWTTTVYAALDTRIKISVPVAGSIPLYLRFDDPGDTEQDLTAFYQMAHYPDLYIMGSYGAGRKQVQVLNRRDDCCFGESHYRADLAGMPWDQAMRRTETQVRHALFDLGSGSFRLEIDEAAPIHQISWNTVTATILAELNGDRVPVGAASKDDAFVRGPNGTLWQAAATGWKDTGLAMAGAPAAVRGAVQPFDVFYRDPANRLMRAYPTGSGWTAESIGGAVISDPVAASSGPGRFDVVALGVDYKPYHWWWNGSGVSSEPVSASVMALGRPAILAAPGRLDIFVRGFDRALYHVWKTGSAPFVQQLVGGTLVGFPTAVASTDPAGTTRLVYVTGYDGNVWQASSLNDGAWRFDRVVAPGAPGNLGGSPGASIGAGAITVYTRTDSGNLASFTRTPGGWRYVNDGRSVSGSPASVDGAAFVRDPDGGLWLFDGSRWVPRGGPVS